VSIVDDTSQKVAMKMTKSHQLFTFSQSPLLLHKFTGFFLYYVYTACLCYPYTNSMILIVFTFTLGKPKSCYSYMQYTFLRVEKSVGLD